MGAGSPRLWLIGCGNMGGAMLSRWIDSGAIDAANVDVVSRTDHALPGGVRQGRALPDGPLPDIVMLAMKPQQLEGVAAAHAVRLAGTPMLVSILAGVEEATIAGRFDVGAIVRAMPNLPVALGKGVVALSSLSADDDARARAAALMAPLGLVEWVDEPSFDAVTALAGSGPAFLYRFIEALAAGGAALGLPAAQAERLAIATVEGGAALAAAASEPPAVLADRVASPGGSTREGLNVLDRADALMVLLEETVAASARHNAVLAAAAR
ncbi:MAG: pyrroline-5-carboxylate reductase dimerization domain-containing protein [Sphingomonas sp.]